MSKPVMGKEHTHTFWHHNFLKYLMTFNPEKVLLSSSASPTIPQILSSVQYVGDTNIMTFYVGDVEDGKRTYAHLVTS